MKRIAFAFALLVVSIGSAAALEDPLFPGKDPLFEQTKCVTDDNGETRCDSLYRKPYLLTDAGPARLIWRSPSALIEGYRLVVDANLLDPGVWKPLIACTITPMKTHVVRVGWLTYQNYSADYFSSLDPVGRYEMATVEVVDRDDPAFGCRGFVLRDRLVSQ
jgi:hypothetical protein